MAKTDPLNGVSYAVAVYRKGVKGGLIVIICFLRHSKIIYECHMT
jgi:hypothetical protein